MSCTHSFRNIVSTYRWKSKEGLLTYWFRCKSCDHKWTVYYDTINKQELQQFELPQEAICRPVKFSEEDIRSILLDGRNDAEIGKYWGVTHQSIQQIKTGKSYKRICPEIPRRAPKRLPVLSCRQCGFWWGGACSLDVPEAGDGFADECSFFKKA